MFEGCERFFRPSYNASLVSAWLPALDGVVAKLQRGATVADVGCGHGASTILMAQAFPASTFVGSDYHEGSIITARERAQAAGVAERVSFEVAPARRTRAASYDLVTMFDCLHDMGDPVGAARHVRDSLSPDGTWLIVEPAAGDRVEDNLNPVGRAYYGFSTLLCTPARCRRMSGGARRAGRRVEDPRCRHHGRPHPVPAGQRDPVQHRVRGAAVGAAGPGMRHGPGEARLPARLTCRGRASGVSVLVTCEFCG